MAEEFAEQPGQRSALWLSTIAFTVCFAVWTIFSIIGIQIKNRSRPERDPVRPAGRHADPDRLADPPRARHLDRPVWRPPRLHGRDAVGGGRDLAADLRARPIRQFLLAALGVGIAGGSFAVGIAYVSRWYPTEQAGHGARHLRRRQCRRGRHQVHRALRLVAYGWQTVAQVWAIAIALMAVVFWFTTKDDPVMLERRAQRRKAASAAGSSSSR